jgi:CheY-like chemotaxis protein
VASERFAVLEAPGGDAAQERSPDVILLDLALSGRSGLEILHVLKERQPTREIPVIIVSAHALLLLRRDERGADDLIQKPFDLADLLMRVRQAVGLCAPVLHNADKCRFSAHPPVWHFLEVARSSVT